MLVSYPVSLATYKKCLFLFCNKFRASMKLEALQNIMNKTASYHRHIFRHPILVKMPFIKIKPFFFQKFPHILYFSKLRNFPISRQKNLTIKVEKTFLKNNII